MNTIVTRVGFGGQSQFFVIVQNGSSDTAYRSGRRIGGTQDFATEILPTERIRGPLDGVPLNFFTGIAIGCVTFISGV